MREIESADDFERVLERGALAGHVVQGVSLGPFAERLRSADLRETLFLGCTAERDGEPGTDHQLVHDLTLRGALWFPSLGDLPFHPYRNSLYTVEELYRGFEPEDPASYEGSVDARIYQWWRSSGADDPKHLRCTLARRLHDLSIADGIGDFLLDRPRPRTGSPSFAGRRIAIMGGHSLSRTSIDYRAIVRLAAHLAQGGALLISGGGPGAMEATHVGTWFTTSNGEPEADFASSVDSSIDAALATLAPAPLYSDERWLSTGFQLRRDLISQGRRPVPSLAIPTWLYGHEPPNPFATHIAKYFNNSLREEGLVTLATGGIVFAPGSAGTVQEIFQDAAQNHYIVGGRVCPMIFLGREYWTEELPVWQLIQALGRGRPWLEMVALVDSVDEAVEALEDRPTRELAEADEHEQVAGNSCGGKEI